MPPGAERFRLELYQRSRPSYSDRLVEFALTGITDGSAPAVTDVGCGTGLSTRPFHRIAKTLVGVEPDAGMRAVAAEALADIGVQALAGSGEATGLPDHSVDLLVAASCFEWFTTLRAAREFRRVLSPVGRVLLMWNHRIVVDEVTFEWDRLWLRHMGPRIGHYPSDIDAFIVPGFLRAPFRCFREVQYFRYDQVRLIEFAFSSGYAPKPSQERRRQALTEAIETFYARHGADNGVSLTFETVAFLGVPRDDLV